MNEHGFSGVMMIFALLAQIGELEPGHAVLCAVMHVEHAVGLPVRPGKDLVNRRLPAIWRIFSQCPAAGDNAGIDIHGAGEHQKECFGPAIDTRAEHRGDLAQRHEALAHVAVDRAVVVGAAVRKLQLALVPG
jgi:hypothetical protein